MTKLKYKDTKNRYDMTLSRANSCYTGTRLPQISSEIFPSRPGLNQSKPVRKKKPQLWLFTPFRAEITKHIPSGSQKIPPISQKSQGDSNNIPKRFVYRKMRKMLPKMNSS